MAPVKKSGRITIRTVAEDAGVSVAAVSKVLRDAYGVSEALRTKVRASMSRLGYRPHAAARGMRGQTYTLGFLIPDMRNPFFSDIFAGVNVALERTQYQTLLGVSESATSIEMALIEAMIDRQMDGLIVIGPRMMSQDVMQVAARLPTVLIGHHATPGANFDTVNNDDRLGAELVVQHLAAAGYSHIAYLNQQVTDAEQTMVTTHREIGYRQAMKDAGLGKHIQVFQALQTSRETQGVVRHMLQSRNRPDAIFCWTDFIALEVLSVARELGLSVPGDLAVVGYDNTAYCDLAQNALTSIDQSGQVLGLQAARLLVERIKGRDQAEHFVVTPRLVARASSSPRRP
ncbi:MAG: LacI family DNA-binding transcriptional regulator [Devosia nanyangense]|uniref:LacI family DNA-binding transcriptional regulator n=1 Tax=Devosia nanyangense TaxID=1228055 RepID=A0A933L0D5_9HYPH|nr:LacI family DNA-binding transcriptional regulator [Devosia nanyangense]